MERVIYSEEKREFVRAKVLELIRIVSELEGEFEGRSFTLDGHLVGSIGEVMAVYYYGVELYRAGAKIHDGIIDGREVQIKITQRDDIVINNEPDYLLAMYLTKKGEVYEIYNGPGKEPWLSASKKDSHNNRHMRVNKLMEFDALVKLEDRIPAKNKPIEKMKKEYKNRN